MTGVQTCALPISRGPRERNRAMGWDTAGGQGRGFQEEVTLELSPEQQDGTGREKTILSRGNSKSKGPGLGWVGRCHVQGRAALDTEQEAAGGNEAGQVTGQVTGSLSATCRDVKIQEEASKDCSCPCQVALLSQSS